MAINWTEQFITKGIGFSIGVLDGYMEKRDVDNDKTTFGEKQANWLTLGGTLIGTAIEVMSPQYAKFAAPVSNACVTLLGRTVYDEMNKPEVPAAGGRARETTFVPRRRVSGSPQFMPPPGYVSAIEGGGVPMAPTSPRYE